MGIGPPVVVVPEVTYINVFERGNLYTILEETGPSVNQSNAKEGTPEDTDESSSSSKANSRSSGKPPEISVGGCQHCQSTIQCSRRGSQGNKEGEYSRRRHSTTSLEATSSQGNRTAFFVCPAAFSVR